MALANTTSQPNPSVRIVGIGASAGGLAALDEFFKAVPANSGLAFVVVQHLDPTQKTLLVELLQRVTRMSVYQASELLRIEPNCVYVIPPNAELSVVDGALKLAKPMESRGLRLPVNVLFSSLAREQRERAIAVVLSGMGTDGTVGMQSIKALGGLTLAQQPDTAQFSAMPHSAIGARCVDIVAPAGAMPARILAYVASAASNQLGGFDPIATAAQADPLQRIFALLRTHTGHDFSLYKNSTIQRRLGRRMSVHGIKRLAQYLKLLENNDQEIVFLFKEFLIGVTSFFRDADVWQELANVTLPALLALRADETQMRAWVAGCSTGEEAYSLAMVFDEVIGRSPKYRNHRLQIFATDLNPDAIALARRGEYPASIAADLSAARLARFFSARDGHYQINQSIRDTVLCAQQDVLLDPPFTKLDMLCCRNLLIYFDATLQRKLLPLFHYSLRPGGMLLLGSSESAGQFSQMFTPVAPKLRLYLRTDKVVAIDAGALGRSFPPLTSTRESPRKEQVLSTRVPVTAPTENLQQAADHILLQTHAPPAVVVNADGDIVYISGHTGAYLEPAAGKANWNFHAMVHEGLRAPLAAALQEVNAQGAARQQATALQSDAARPQGTDKPAILHLRGLRMEVRGRVYRVDVTVQALPEPGALQDMVMIVFRDVPKSLRRARRMAQGDSDTSISTELQSYRNEIQTLRAQTRASKEELQAANEELQSTNEELQSANEELTTSKEEMQSMNEELQTVNSEMQHRLDDLAVEQGDMKNLLNSTDIAILFLDQELNVRRYTDRAAKIVRLRDTDIGRPLSDLTSSLQYAALHDDAQETMRTLATSEKQIATDDGRWFSVRIIPYRRLDNMIDGAVVTLVDITDTKKLESKLREASK